MVGRAIKVEVRAVGGIPVFLSLQALLRGVEEGSLKAGEIWKGLYFLDYPRPWVLERLWDPQVDPVASQVTRIYVYKALMQAEREGRVRWFQYRQDKEATWHVQFASAAARWVEAFGLRLSTEHIRTYQGFTDMFRWATHLEGEE